MKGPQMIDVFCPEVRSLIPLGLNVVKRLFQIPVPIVQGDQVFPNDDAGLGGGGSSGV